MLLKRKQPEATSQKQKDEKTLSGLAAILANLKDEQPTQPPVEEEEPIPVSTFKRRKKYLEYDFGL